jgi:hypothetical protein
MSHPPTSCLLRKPTGKLRQRPRQHLTRGTEKTGPMIFTFNLPAVLTCPGMSAACASCYARRNRWVFSNVQKALHRNWQASREPFFAERMVREIVRRQAQVVRIHSSGDFYDLPYIRNSEMGPDHPPLSGHTLLRLHTVLAAGGAPRGHRASPCRPFQPPALVLVRSGHGPAHSSAEGRAIGMAPGGCRR